MEMINRTGRMWGKTKQVARKLAKVVTSAVLVSGLMLAAPKPAQANSIEFMAGHKSAVVDIKASAKITDELGLFFRVRPSMDYTGTISSFGLADLSIKLTDGLDAVGEIQLIGGTPIPRAGLQHFIKAGDFSAYNLATIGLDSKPYLELLTALSYSPALSETIELLTKIENVSDLDASGHIWSTQRVRVGISLDGFGFGAAVDLTETGNHANSSDDTFGWNLGGFVSKTF
ncbi:MAG: hypothetical protein ABH842_01220 [Candidatus Micrarchaeota archaeon]